MQKTYCDRCEKEMDHNQGTSRVGHSLNRPQDRGVAPKWLDLCESCTAGLREFLNPPRSA